MNIRAAVLLTALFLQTPIAWAETCDCSCSAFSQLKTLVHRFEQQLDQGQTAMVTPLLQRHLQCMNPCADQWVQCPASSAPESGLTQHLIGEDSDPHGVEATRVDDPFPF